MSAKDGPSMTPASEDARAEIERLYAEWQASVQRGRPDRFAKHKAYLAAWRAASGGPNPEAAS